MKKMKVLLCVYTRMLTWDAEHGFKCDRCGFGDARALEIHHIFGNNYKKNWLAKFLKASEIDFLHGRVTGSVFMANYFNPSLIGDLCDRTLKGIMEIQEKIKT